MYTHLIGQVYHVKVKTILSRISTQEKFPRTENFPKTSLLKVENFQLQNCFPTENLCRQMSLYKRRGKIYLKLINNL